jgi:hypothetical protein
MSGLALPVWRLGAGKTSSTASRLTAVLLLAFGLTLTAGHASSAAESEPWLDEAFSKASIVGSDRASPRHRAVRAAERAPVDSWDDDEDAPRPVQRARTKRTPAAKLRAAAREPRHTGRKTKRTRVASLGRFEAPAPARQPSLTGGRIQWVASAGCLASSLRSVINQIAANFGPVRVNSTCRSRRHNARVGGAHRSYHLRGAAVDFRVSSNVRSVYAYLRGSGAVGGLKHYGHGLFHIDNGPRRSW